MESKYKYKSDVKASDLWLIAMRRTYKSPTGIVNIIFTVAMILLTLRFWGAASDIIRSLMVLGCILFPVIQPLAVLGASARQLDDMPRNLELSFSDRGVLVTTGEKSESLPWKRIKNAIMQRNMIVIMSDDRHGYMLTNRVLGQEKEEFYNFLCDKIRA
ncbi:MAG: YcxB family protein [Butyrivibrio sp.]|nr:YcxB family protein [Butyrivibrio sp.]